MGFGPVKSDETMNKKLMGTVLMVLSIILLLVSLYFRGQGKVIDAVQLAGFISLGLGALFQYLAKKEIQQN